MDNFGIWDLNTHSWCLIKHNDTSSYRGSFDDCQKELIKYKFEYPDGNYEVSQHQSYCHKRVDFDCCMSKIFHNTQLENIKNQIKNQRHRISPVAKR